MIQLSSSIGYVVVYVDKEMERMGRDIVIALRGTSKCPKWAENLRGRLSLMPESDESIQGDSKFECGFLKFYKRDEAREPLVEEVERLLKLCSIDNLMEVIGLGDSLAFLVTNRGSASHINKSNAKVLIVANNQDVLARVPGIFMEGTKKQDRNITATNGICRSMNCKKKYFKDAEDHDVYVYGDRGDPRLNGVRKSKRQLAELSEVARRKRKSADRAILAKQKWWEALDFAELNRVVLFGVGKQKTAVSRWQILKIMTSKIGKGLTKNEKARMLDLKHWLEAIDPHHRYGHNLQYYYQTWYHCPSKQRFFYWLDIGEGREVNHLESPRWQLQQQCIKYLGPTERYEYEVVMEGTKFIYKKSGKLLDTTGRPKDAKWIFVLSASKSLYVGQKNKGKFQHSSFLAGGAILSAGRLVAENGILKSVWPHSGHYLPTEENFHAFISFLREHGVDTENLQKIPAEEEEEGNIKKSSRHGHSLEAEICKYNEATEAKSSAQEDTDSREESCKAAESSGKLGSRLF